MSTSNIPSDATENKEETPEPIPIPEPSTEQQNEWYDPPCAASRCKECD